MGSGASSTRSLPTSAPSELNDNSKKDLGEIGVEEEHALSTLRLDHAKKNKTLFGSSLKSFTSTFFKTPSTRSRTTEATQSTSNLGKDREDVTSTSAERGQLLYWKFWTSSMLHVMSFIDLEEIVDLTLVSKDWHRLVNRYLRNYEPVLPKDELDWIQRQVDQNTSFFEKTMMNITCRVVVNYHDLPEGDSIESMLTVPEIADLQERIRHHRGHYATFPALAMQLLSSLGSANDTSKVHEQTFRCRHHQRRVLIAGKKFLAVVLEFMRTTFAEIKPSLENAKLKLTESIDLVLNREVERFMQFSDDVDGRSITTFGILSSDVLENAPHYQSAVERKMGIIQRELQEELDPIFITKFVELEQKKSSAQREFQFVLEMTEEESCWGELDKLFHKYRDFLFKSFFQSYLEPLLLQYTSPEKYCDEVFLRLDAHLAKNDAGPKITQPFYKLIGILNVNPASIEIEDSMLSMNNDFLAEKFPGLPNYEALSNIESEIDKFLDHFMDQCSESELEIRFLAQKDFEEEKNRENNQNPLPTSVSELEAMPTGWLAPHLEKLYTCVCECEDPGALARIEEREEKERKRSKVPRWKTSLRDFSMRRYVYHALQKENSTRALNYGARGNIVPPLDKRREHIKALSKALRHSILRDFGPNLSDLPGNSYDFFDNLLHHDVYATAIISMSLKCLVDILEGKRKMMVEFEKQRRRSDLD